MVLADQKETFALVSFSVSVALLLLELSTTSSSHMCALVQSGNVTFLKDFDIVAVQPATEKLFAVILQPSNVLSFFSLFSVFTVQQACSELDVDIISLELGSRIPYYFKTPQIGQVSAACRINSNCLPRSFAGAHARRVFRSLLQ